MSNPTNDNSVCLKETRAKFHAKTSGINLPFFLII